MTIRIEQSIWIDRPVPVVFDFISDASNFSKYIPGLIEAERIGLDVASKGDHIRSKMSVLGTKLEVLAEWTRYEPNVAIGSRNVEGMPVDMLTTFHEENGGTRIERVLNMEPKGLFGTITAPLVRRTADRNAVTEFETLKELLEN
ncbi:MAG: SRPBCC family protein [Deltaproteobacteria bacterium]|nr:SRPBCC family protein [Deltaproteobacteria bacterium]